jgi:glucosamine--fructose-6-phosphate aminotransferase (isomerizing)
MCGIVAYVGENTKAYQVLIEGLRSLEYRGYDSAGIALQVKTELENYKSKGKIKDLEDSINDLSDFQKEQSNCGIGHTRWATHGEPNQVNAHPHSDEGETLSLVHNGIIRNFQALKDELLGKGYSFKSATDSEVIANLVAELRKQGLTRFELMRALTLKLEGSYALAVIIRDQPEQILLAKNESPLVIGVGGKENYAASDSDTVLQFTDKIIRLKDKQIAIISAYSVQIEDFKGQVVMPQVQVLKQTDSILNKDGYKHFLLKEIHEQPQVITRMLAGVLNTSPADFKLMEFSAQLKDVTKVYCIGCGSAYHSALVLKYLLSKWVKLPCEVVVASEFYHNYELLQPTDIVLGISQSGETADTMLALTSAKEAGAQVFAITNKIESAIHHLCGANTYITPADIEISVASSKAFTSQVMAHYLFSLQLASAKQTLSETEIAVAFKELKSIPILIEQILNRIDNYKNELLAYSSYKDFIFLGRGINYAIALEGALKLKELSYAHASAYPGGELKHGPIAILDEKVPVVTLAIPSEIESEQVIYEKMIHNAIEAKARKSPSILITTDANPVPDNGDFDTIIRIPDVDQIFSPIIATIPLQFMAYYIAEDLGKDVDQPRNLAKSVTVE